MKRHLHNDIEDFSFYHNKMVFVSGPRQVGKTTLGKMFMTGRESSRYYTWDDIVFRRAWVKNPKTLVPAKKKDEKPILVLDEIHKTKDWKSRLKGIYDTLQYPCDIVVTGSARLDIYRKGGDSLVGRYHLVRLHPFSIAELTRKKTISPDQFAKNFQSKPIHHNTIKKLEHTLNQLLTVGGFPEPYLSNDKRFYNVWQRNRLERLINEDLRDLSRLPELAKLELLGSILQEKVGGLLSIQSLCEDFEVSYPTMQRWLNALKHLFLIFTVPTYHRNINRALKKSSKIYLWDWAEVDDTGSKIENLVASHLIKACDYWNDFGFGSFQLYLLRDKERREVDFAVTRDNKIWLLLEVKKRKEPVSPSLLYFTERLKPTLSIQASLDEPNLFNKKVLHNSQIIETSLSRFLYNLI